ncbi:MAG: 6-carboxytetrahydropterin synthase QueD [Desulfobacterales bacterium]|nr:6-carboxytetrahydropterin synthase QueD [Deltaproteobacteria bacterium]NNK95283.1 6-carboxytetrahydropterin synthase QueD [Desulfobacterales bacterium]
MYDIFVKTHFSSGHHLRDYPGSCELPHGHNWKVTVTVRAAELDEIGMGIDFKLLKKQVNSTVDYLDHKVLNDLPEFSTINPSSEHIARFIFDRLKESLSHDRYELYSVTIFETDTSGLTYYGPNSN